MIGAIIGGGLKVAGSIFGGLAARRAAKKQNKIISAARSKNQAWYDRRYNEDATQQADAQASLARMRDAMAQRSKASAGAAAVTGAGLEAQAVDKQAQNEALAQTTSDIAVQGAQTKAAIEAQYRAQDSALTDAQLGVQQQKLSAIQTTIGNAGNAGAEIANAVLPKK